MRNSRQQHFPRCEFQREPCPWLLGWWILAGVRCSRRRPWALRGIVRTSTVQYKWVRMAYFWLSTYIRVSLIHILLLRLIGNDRCVRHEFYIRQNHCDHRIYFTIDILDLLLAVISGYWWEPLTGIGPASEVELISNTRFLAANPCCASSLRELAISPEVEAAIAQEPRHRTRKNE